MKRHTGNDWPTHNTARTPAALFLHARSAFAAPTTASVRSARPPRSPIFLWLHRQIAQPHSTTDYLYYEDG